MYQPSFIVSFPAMHSCFVPHLHFKKVEPTRKSLKSDAEHLNGSKNTMNQGNGEMGKGKERERTTTIIQ